ncbi:hypothetical protein SNEBB_004978 [Seison nebaliae]|nr:hypothetical protein SNEBB_004978 [Seison nebaliae]
MTKSFMKHDIWNSLNPIKRTLTNMGNDFNRHIRSRAGTETGATILNDKEDKRHRMKNLERIRKTFSMRRKQKFLSPILDDVNLTSPNVEHTLSNGENEQIGTDPVMAVTPSEETFIPNTQKKSKKFTEKTNNFHKKFLSALKKTNEENKVPDKPHSWQIDEENVRKGQCEFQVKYMGFVEVFESRGLNVCEQSIAGLRKKEKNHVKAVLIVSGDTLRVVDDQKKCLLVDQTIEKVSFCAPDRYHSKGFAYICRDGTTRRWLCHAFLANKESGERLSHAVGCAFAICLERKQKRDKKSCQDVHVTYSANGCQFERTGSFRSISLKDRRLDPQLAILPQVTETAAATPTAAQKRQSYAASEFDCVQSTQDFELVDDHNKPFGDFTRSYTMTDMNRTRPRSSLSLHKPMTQFTSMIPPIPPPSDTHMFTDLPYQSSLENNNQQSFNNSNNNHQNNSKNINFQINNIQNIKKPSQQEHRNSLNPEVLNTLFTQSIPNNCTSRSHHHQRAVSEVLSNSSKPLNQQFNCQMTYQPFKASNPFAADVLNGYS